MAKRRVDVTSPETLGAPLPTVSIEQVAIIIPTGNPRHMSHIREGKLDPNCFSKKYLATLPVDAYWDGDPNATIKKVKKAKKAVAAVTSEEAAA